MQACKPMHVKMKSFKLAPRVQVSVAYLDDIFRCMYGILIVYMVEGG